MVNTISKAAHKVGGKVRKSKKVAKSIKGKKGRTSMRKTMKKKRGGIGSGPYKLNLMKSLHLKSKTGATKEITSNDDLNDEQKIDKLIKLRATHKVLKMEPKVNEILAFFVEREQSLKRWWDDEYKLDCDKHNSKDNKENKDYCKSSWFSSNKNHIEEFVKNKWDSFVNHDSDLLNHIKEYNKGSDLLNIIQNEINNLSQANKTKAEGSIRQLLLDISTISNMEKHYIDYLQDKCVHIQHNVNNNLCQ
jgi:hypothetical protein